MCWSIYSAADTLSRCRRSLIGIWLGLTTSWAWRNSTSQGNYFCKPDLNLLTRCDLDKSYELTLHLEDGDDDDLVKKNKKKKTLGYIVVRLVLSPLTKEEYNEVNQWDSNSLLLSLSLLLTACFFFLF